MTTFLQVCAALGGLTFVAGIITALALWRKSRSEAHKLDVDAAKVLTDSAVQLLEPIRAELQNANAKLEAMRRHLEVVEGLLRSAGVPVPVFRWPPDVKVAKSARNN